MRRVDIAALYSQAVRAIINIPQGEQLLGEQEPRHLFEHTGVQVMNETTLVGCARRLMVDQGHHTCLALIFASPSHPGGGVLSGARAQEECLCQSIALYVTLERGPM